MRVDPNWRMCTSEHHGGEVEEGEDEHRGDESAFAAPELGVGWQIRQLHLLYPPQSLHHIIMHSPTHDSALSHHIIMTIIAA